MVLTTESLPEIDETDAILKVTLEFVPNPGSPQQEIIDCMKRFVLVSGGDQSGKSYILVKFFHSRWPSDMVLRKDPDEPLLYWLIGADYSKTVREFGYMVQDFVKIFGQAAVKATKKVDPGYIEIAPGAPKDPKVVLKVETKSAKDPHALVAYAIDGAMLCEAAQIDLETYMRCQSRVGPKKGWIMLAGTLEHGSLGWFPPLIKAWASGAGDGKSFKMPSWTNPYSYPGGRNDSEILRLERDNPDSFFMERIAGEAVPPRGLVFERDFRPDIHIRNHPYVPGETVYIWVDPGYGSTGGSAYAIEAAQIIDGQVRLFKGGEIYERGKTTEDVIDICQMKPWWAAKDKVLVIDPNYRDQHHANSSVAEVWRRITGLVCPVAEKVSVSAGIERLQVHLKVNPVTEEPGVVISPDRKGILSEFGAELNPFDGVIRTYNWKTDRDGNIIGLTPDNKHCDGIKALIYGLVDQFGYARPQKARIAQVVSF